MILYELLSGRSPYRTPPDRSGQLYLAIRDEEPDRPSAAVWRAATPAGEGATVAPTAESVSQARGTDPGTLARQLAGDLDRMVARALRKWPRNRYSSVAELAGELRRHLEEG